MYDLFSQPAPSAMIIPLPPRPEEHRPQATAPRLFTNIADVIKEIRKIGHAEELNYSQFTQLYKDVTSQTPAIMAMINKMTIAEILTMCYMPTPF